ncbi:hypothetical protein [Filimonas effusa]|uniref:Uncharacterized protein n=1 Tax=Filimonas effusa TaxID=2508721 RepID=A0A4Q1D7B4_9BACT|nr:hypothetical protein [Filimonas effusa]RXK83631.1 hypothetical protein ESB13_16235 [Filimonas effusa]
MNRRDSYKKMRALKRESRRPGKKAGFCARRRIWDVKSEDDWNTDFLINVGRSAAINAINASKALGIPITYLENNKVVKEEASGQKSIVQELPEVQLRRFKKGTVIHVRKVTRP